MRLTYTFKRYLCQLLLPRLYCVSVWILNWKKGKLFLSNCSRRWIHESIWEAQGISGNTEN